LRVGHVDPAAVDESSIGFRLAPRINASGRLCVPSSARAALDRGRARGEGAREELETLNRERKLVEERILREAVDEVEFVARNHAGDGADTSSRARAGTKA